MKYGIEIDIGGTLKALCDIYVALPEEETAPVQELTLPVYHAWCRMSEHTFWGIRTGALGRGRDRFEFLVNGKKIFLLGTNFVPIDAFHSRDRERLPRVMELLRDSGCNAIRIWGGGVYEDDFLYEECDRMGILLDQTISKAFLTGVLRSF